MARKTWWHRVVGLEPALDGATDERQIDDVRPYELGGWELDERQIDKQRKIVASVIATAKRHGIDRRRFLASSAGIMTALGVASHLAGRPRRRAPQPAQTGNPCLDAASIAPAGAGFRAGFAHAAQSTQAEWMWIAMATIAQQPAVPQTILAMVKNLDGLHAGFKVHQLHHALQTASMAKRANANDDTVLSALLHDVGKVISIEGHPEIASGIIKPYVAEENYHVIRTHQDFQGRHYYGYIGRSTTLRDQYRNEPWYALAERFTDEWDQAAFDPAYPIMQLAEFEPLIQQYFTKPVLRGPALCG